MDGFDMGGIPALAEEHRMVRDLVVKFVERDLMPLEAGGAEAGIRGPAATG